jgi:hypothetical protein
LLERCAPVFVAIQSADFFFARQFCSTNTSPILFSILVSRFRHCIVPFSHACFAFMLVVAFFVPPRLPMLGHCVQTSHSLAHPAFETSCCLVSPCSSICVHTAFRPFLF